MPKRIAAFLTFPSRADAREGMRILAGLGYGSIELPEIVDQADDRTTFVEASKPLPAVVDECAEPDCGALDEIQNAIGHLGDCSEVGAADDKKIDWCGPTSTTAGEIVSEEDGAP